MDDDVIERRTLNERLERRIGHVERQLAVHGEQLVLNSQAIASMKETSAERLQYIKERFDETRDDNDKILKTLEKRSAFGKWMTNLVLGVLIVMAGAINSLYLEPMAESINTLERRILTMESKRPPAPMEPE